MKGLFLQNISQCEISINMLDAAFGYIMVFSMERVHGENPGKMIRLGFRKQITVILETNFWQEAAN